MRQFIEATPPNIIISIWIASILFVVYASLKSDIQFPADFSNADKTYHMLAYAWLAFLSFWIFKQRKVAFVVMFSLIFLGCTLEYAQSFIQGRSCSVWDEAANSLGVILGMLAGEYL